MEMVNSFTSALEDPGGPEMKMHFNLRSRREETVQTVEKREKGE